MSNVIDFKTPAQMREELVSRDEEIRALKAQLSRTEAVKEMLTLQVLDLKDQVDSHVDQMKIIQDNLNKLLEKLSLA